MSELKTLNDIEYEEECLYSHYTLKQEAIKWIKEIQKKSDEHWQKLDDFGFVCFPKTNDENAYFFTLDGLVIKCWHEDSSYSSIIEWIKHFFNITEEDLK